MSVELYKHNKRAYENVKEHFKTSNRTCVVHPTGSGKSYISLKFLEENIDKKSLILAPTYPILDQFKRNIMKNMLEMNPEEYTQLEIDRIINSNYPNINFEIYQNVNKRLIEEKYDVMVLDEFHRCGANEWGKGVNSLLENNEEAKVLGVSATPIRYLDDMRDMSEEIFNGDVSSRITLIEAIADGILPVPTNINAIYSFMEDIETIQNEIDKYKDKEKQEELQKSLNEAKQKIEKANGLEEIFKKYITKDNGKYIVFCKSLEDMREKEKEVTKWFGKINNNINISEVYHVLGREKNQEIIDKFERSNDDSLKLLFCIDILNEGLHVDGIDGVIMLRPTISPIIYFQQLGRALAVGEDNTPLIFDIVNNIDCIENIQNLREEIKKEINRTKSSNGIKYTVEEIEERRQRLLSFMIFDEYKDLRNILKQLEEETSYVSWDDNFELLKRYLYEHNGEYPRNHSKNEEEKRIASWVGTQRTIYNNGIFQSDKSKDYNGRILTQERIDKLNSIGFIWKEKTSDEKWEENFDKLKQFLKEHNGEYPNNHSKNEEEKRIASWVSTQRTIYNNGELLAEGIVKYNRGILTKEQIDKLNSIKFIWKAKTLDEKWEENFELLKKFLEEHNGRYPKYKSVDKLEKQLAEWASNCRRIYCNGEIQRDGSIKSTRGILTKVQIDKLNSIKFIWNPLDEKWEENFKLLKIFLKEHNGEYPKKSSKDQLKKQLDDWVIRQRKSYSKGELAQERIEKLNSIGIIINGKKRFNTWEENFELLKQFIEEHNGEYPKNYSKDELEGKLANWIRVQRSIYNNGEKNENGSIKSSKGILTKEQIDKLKSINFIFVVKEKVYQKKEITTKGEVQGRQRYLKDKIDELLKIKENIIRYNDNIQNLRDDFIESLDVKKK